MFQNQVELEQMDLTRLQELKTTARQKTWKAVEDIKNLIKPGMSEKEAIKLGNEYLAGQGVKKFWHRTHVRFGESTVLSFDDPYKESEILKEEDIFFIDIGPVWDGVEGDSGNTFAVGSKKEHSKIIKDVKVLFDEVKEFWRKENPAGTKLYEKGLILADKMGYLLHPSYVKGHRLSEFAHSKYTTIGMADLEFTPSPERWILEFQICSKSKRFGAFYEDLLD